MIVVLSSDVLALPASTMVVEFAGIGLGVVWDNVAEIVEEPVDASDVELADAGGELPPWPVSGASSDLVDELEIVVPLR